MSVVALLAACSESTAPSGPAVVSTPVDPATAGRIEVTVTYDGPVPTPRVLSMSSAPQCAAAHTEPVYDQSLAVNAGRLSNAVVWIKGGLEDWVFAPPHRPAVIDQKGCLYEPRVSAAMVNQPVEFLNSDPEPHNVHGRPSLLRGWNFIMSRQGSSRTMTFDKVEVAIPVGCDIHPWMRAYLAIVPNPYFGVTGPSGEVRLTEVPPGQYVIAAWHEKLGSREQKVTLSARTTATVQLHYSAE